MGSNDNTELILFDEDVDMIADEIPCGRTIATCSELVDEDPLELDSLVRQASDFRTIKSLLNELHERGVNLREFINALWTCSPDVSQRLAEKYQIGGEQSSSESDSESQCDSNSQSESERERRSESESDSQDESQSDSQSESESDSSNEEWLNDANDLLRKGLKKDSAKFTPDQLKVLHSLLVERNSTLFITRTGGGKSATYFVTTKLLRKQEGAGPTIVISPLVALMTDQVTNAEKFDLKAATYNCSTPDQQSVIASLKENMIDILFVSPEMLTRGNFAEQVPQLQGGSWTLIPLLVIDEVHCISQWGHDFRLSYFSGLRSLMKQPWTKDVPVLGTSATVPQLVLNDIQRVFGCDFKIVQGDLFRENLAIRVIYGGHTLTEKINWLKEFIAQKSDGKNILIFSLKKEEVEQISTDISTPTRKASFYHAGIESKQRKQIEDDFRSGNIKILVSTTALSMGFDKSDIHFVIHTYTPASAVQYYQEIGRAGRGIKSATAYLLHSHPWSPVAKRDAALQEILAILEEHIDKPRKIQWLLGEVVIKNISVQAAEDAIDLGFAKGYFAGGWLEDEIVLPAEVSQQVITDNKNFIEARQQELQFMKDLTQLAKTQCIWINLLQFLGKETEEDFKCQKCNCCDKETQDIRMVSVPELWRMKTNSNILVYAFGCNIYSPPRTKGPCREFTKHQPDLRAAPNTWAMTYIPTATSGAKDPNQKDCYNIASQLGIEVYEFITRKPGCGSMRDANTEEERERVIESKFILDETKLPPPGCNVLICDDSVKSGMTIDKIASVLTTKNPKRRVIALVATIWSCKDVDPPTKLYPLD